MASTTLPSPEAHVLPAPVAQNLPPPRQWRVIMLNDDFTPMDFVVEVLRDIFVMHPLTANQVMLEIHHHDRAIVGSYTHEIALQRVAQVKALSELEGHPLLCIAEPEPNI